MIANVRVWFAKLAQLLELPAPEAARRLHRLQKVERNLVLPIKAAAVLLVVYSFHITPWFGLTLGWLDVTVRTVQTTFTVYVSINLICAVLLLLAQRLPLAVVEWTVLTSMLVDGVFAAALTLVCGGYDSVLFWLFALLIVRNAASTPPVWSQLALSLYLSLCYIGAGLLDLMVSARVAEELTRGMRQRNFGTTTNVLAPAAAALEDGAGSPLDMPAMPGGVSETFVMRVVVLVLIAVWLYGMQVLLEKQRLAEEEAHELLLREGQLRSAGRLGAEFAHQIKNPLAIMNNALYSLRRALATGKGDPQRPLAIIEEEIEHADRIITQVMGYAQLSEGHVEKLDLVAEVEHALGVVFPPAAGYTTQIRRDFAPRLPAVTMLKRHLTDLLVNLLQNAREALQGQGTIWLSARCVGEYQMELVIGDNGPGVPAEQLERIFEAYFSTKEKGTGLGLAIVKNNIELYGGSVRAESALGNGTRFILSFPVKAPLTTAP